VSPQPRVPQPGSRWSPPAVVVAALLAALALWLVLSRLL
jgi:hypothetical protein